MSVRPRRVAAALTTLALGAGLVVTATQASADSTTTPPWETGNASAVGTLSFYDSTGAVITKGSTSSGPFAAYAVASKAVRSGDTSARLLIANPQKGSDVSTWYRSDAGISTYPNAAAPAAVTTAAAGNPVWSSTSSSPTLDTLTANFAPSTDSAYKNYVQVRLVTTNAANQVNDQYATADLLIDPTAHTWTEVFPTNSGGTTPTGAHATSLLIASTPQIAYGKKGTVKAALRDTDASNAGVASASLTLQQRFSANGAWSNAGTATTNSAGDASATVAPGTYRQYRWVYAGSSSFKASTSTAARTLVSQLVSGYVTSASIKSGANVKFYGAVSPVLVGEVVYLQQQSGSTWKTLSTVKGAVKFQKLPNGKSGYSYVLSLNPKTKGSYVFRAYAPSTKNNTYGVSVAHLVKVS